jgi:LuxR family maltose regulon positive regulatory protein
MVSALERFNADLADVVCGWHVSSRLVRELEKLAALIVPLDYDRQWYRLCQHRDKNGPGTGLKRGQLG